MATPPRDPDLDLVHDDAEPTAAERAQARTFAELIDKTISGRTPAVMSADDRALLEVATVIRATAGELPLAPARQRVLVEDALRQAIGGKPTSRTGVVPIGAARAKRWAPWLVAATTTLAAAAALALLWLRPAPQHVPQAAARIPAAWTSRPSDALIGPITADRSGDASARLDYIFADRLDGYRERELARGGSR